MRQVDLFDDYLNGLLSGEEKTNFENELKNNEIINKAFQEHKQLLEVLQTQNKRKQLKDKLKAIHHTEYGHNTKIFSINQEETFAKRHGKTIAVAASTAFIAVLTTVALLSTGGYLFTKQNNQITNLNRIVMDLKASQDGIVEGITRPKRTVYAPAKIEGSAFALNNQGYVITSYHMVKDADSVFIQNKDFERSLTRVILSNPKLDIAILKVENTELIKNWQVPFSIKEKNSDVGEKVFTLGYPREDMVYGEGSLSSLSGYANDSSMYQISIPVNPGNSGGPLLDEYGNIIGVVRGKISGAEATGFAVKASEIISTISNAPDSTQKEVTLLKNKKNALKHLKRTEQIKKINPYVFNVLVYK
ncbi:MAG: trypsin-like peptidase domain-containing protein [Bacteroidia bacterium]|nr:trypsin-like peptidase domain-containing protein [Bacteroidia bacterium]